MTPGYFHTIEQDQNSTRINWLTNWLTKFLTRLTLIEFAYILVKNLLIMNTFTAFFVSRTNDIKQIISTNQIDRSDNCMRFGKLSSLHFASNEDVRCVRNEHSPCLNTAKQWIKHSFYIEFLQLRKVIRPNGNLYCEKIHPENDHPILCSQW